MPGTVTTNFRKHNAEQFYEAFSEADESRMYFFIGRSTTWADDASPPTPQDTVQETEYDVWNSMLAAKRVQTADVSYSVTRNNWANNTFYSDYDNVSSIRANTFFIMTTDYNVYKCLYNNGANNSVHGANSTVQPTGTSTSTLSTSDGYKWKYMYSISTADVLKFLTTSYIPVTTDSTVSAAASNGAIDVVDVDAGGNLYVANKGGVVSVTNSSVMVLNSSASTTDDIYNGSGLYISSGTGSGQVATIQSYVGSSRTITLSSGYSVSPVGPGDSQYDVGPRIAIAGDGTGAVAYANVVIGGASGNTVNKISMISVGSKYSTANVTITANSSHGTGATATPRLAPPGGHGSNAVSELFGMNVMVNVQLTGSEGGAFPTGQDFRVFGLLKDPLTAAGAAATASAYDQTTRLTISSVSSSARYTKDELITGGTSNAKARVVSFANTNAANTAGTLALTNVDKTFTTSETITGGSSGITASIGAVASNGDLLPYKGKVLYVENRGAIQRATDQTEDIKIVVKF
jgi:hypothetical protein